MNASLGTNDYAAVNQGQVKQFTARAVDELNADLTNNGGAGAALTNLVYGWQQDYATNGYNATNLEPSDFNVMNVGQLKYIASLVYGQLSSAGYTGLYPSWLQVNTNTDHVAANVGQLKEVFNFDLSVAPAMVTGVTASASNAGEIDLSWTLPVLNNATSITIEESTDGGITWTTAATLTDPTLSSYAMTGLSQGSSYQFAVVAGNSAGSSAASTPTTSTMAPVTPRYAVIDLGTNFFPVVINNHGIVVGSTSTNYQVWSPTRTTNVNLPHTPFGVETVTGMNDAGEIVGSGLFNMAPWNFQETHACYWASPSATPVDLDGMANTNGNSYDLYDATNGITVYQSVANGIGRNHLIYGTMSFLWPPLATVPAQFTTTAIPTPTPAWADSNYGTNGDVTASIASVAGTNYAGNYYYGDASDSATNNGLILNGMQVPAPLDTNFPSIGAAAINASGAVVGTQEGGTWPLTRVFAPFLFIHKVKTAVGPAGEALALNNLCTTTVTGGVTNVVATPQIIGNDYNGSAATLGLPANPMLWDQTYYDGTPSTNTAYGGYVAKNLNLLIPGATGTNTPPWQITSAVGINNGGAIVGSAIKTATGTTNGVMLVPASITRDGLPINSTNNTVCVGQQINLTNVISGVPTTAITSYQWTIPGVAFKDYEPDGNNSNYTNLAPSDLTNSYCNFYWSDGATNRIVTCTQVMYGQTNTVSATFNVARPTGMILVSKGSIGVGPNNSRGIANGLPYLYCGKNEPGPPIDVGIYFSQTISEPSQFTGGTNEWLQVINNATVTKTSAGLPSSRGTSGVDSTDLSAFFYGFNPGTNGTSDSPCTPLFSTNTVGYESFSATMYLMWQPPTNSVGGDRVVWVPLRSVPWNWSATATNATPTNINGWGLQTNNYPSNTNDYDTTNEPTWAQHAQSSWHSGVGP